VSTPERRGGEVSERSDETIREGLVLALLIRFKSEEFNSLDREVLYLSFPYFLTALHVAGIKQTGLEGRALEGEERETFHVPLGRMLKHAADLGFIHYDKKPGSDDLDESIIFLDITPAHVAQERLMPEFERAFEAALASVEEYRRRMELPRSKRLVP
jgi:hypothetical protein